MSVRLVVGTVKGGFVVEANDARTEWRIGEPIFGGWKLTAVRRLASGEFLAGTASDVYGPALHKSRDLREWKQVAQGPAWPAGSDRKLKQVWTIHELGDRLLCGVDDAGLFESTDGGDTWTSVEGLNEHPTRAGWFPGFGGMCCHSILGTGGSLWSGISAVGVFRSDDGGATWQPKNTGVPVIIEDKDHKDIGYCVHALAQDPDDPNRIWRRDHRGMFRTTDGGDSWQRIEQGLPSSFGFPLVIDRKTKALYCFPLESDEIRMPIAGRFEVYRSVDGGDSWHSASNGLPDAHAYMGVLRQSMAVDELEPCGVYVGTTAGTLHVSNDGADSWRNLPCNLPRILCVEAFAD